MSDSVHAESDTGDLTPHSSDSPTPDPPRLVPPVVRPPSSPPAVQQQPAPKPQLAPRELQPAGPAAAARPSSTAMSAPAALASTPPLPPVNADAIRASQAGTPMRTAPKTPDENTADESTPDESTPDESTSQADNSAPHEPATGRTDLPVLQNEKKPQEADTSPGSSRAWRVVGWPWRFAGKCWRVASVFVLLAVAAAVPILQFASLGYLLYSAARLAEGQPWSRCLPGKKTAGRITTFTALSALCWLPVWLVTDLSYSAQLLQPDSPTALGWRIAAVAISAAWVMHIAWAAARGGRWWHFVWPAPIRFLTSAWRPSTWARLSDEIYETLAALEIPRLWWLGLRAATGALLWTCVPVSMMIIGQRADGGGGIVLVGLLGAIAMTLVMLYLPFLQIQMAQHDRFSALFSVRQVRRRFLFAPLAHAVSLTMLCLLCLPLYLLRIEAVPAELQWAPCLIFVLFMLPAKWLLGAAMAYADRRRDSLPVSEANTGRRSWLLRWPARLLALASVLIYVGGLYVAQLVAGQGAWVMYFQHALLVPAPLLGS